MFLRPIDDCLTEQRISYFCFFILTHKDQNAKTMPMLVGLTMHFYQDNQWLCSRLHLVNAYSGGSSLYLFVGLKLTVNFRSLFKELMIDS